MRELEQRAERVGAAQALGVDQVLHEPARGVLQSLQSITTSALRGRPLDISSSDKEIQ